MPRKKSSSGQSGVGSAGNQPAKYDVKWCNYDLKREEIETLASVLRTGEWNWSAQLAKMTLDGYTFSIKYDFKNNAHVAFCFASERQKINYNMALTGHGRNGLMALIEVLYKHYVLDGVWPKPKQVEAFETWDSVVEL